MDWMLQNTKTAVRLGIRSNGTRTVEKTEVRFSSVIHTHDEVHAVGIPEVRQCRHDRGAQRVWVVAEPSRTTGLSNPATTE
jgi:hypothetical protein